MLHTFKGEAAEDGYGRSVAMSEDNNTIAIGGFRNDGGGTNSGHARVFRKTNGAWLQLGSDIDGESANDYSGVSLDLSADGSVLEVGEYLNDGNGAMLVMLEFISGTDHHGFKGEVILMEELKVMSNLDGE